MKNIFYFLCFWGIWTLFLICSRTKKKKGLKHLSSLSSIEIIINEKNAGCHRITEPNKIQEKLLKAAEAALPKILPKLNTSVVSRKKLQEQRITT